MKNKPRNTEEWYQRGYHLMAEGRYSESIKAYSMAIEHDLEYAEAYFARGACYYKLGYYRKAVDDIKTAAVLGSENAIFWSR